MTGFRTLRRALVVVAAACVFTSVLAIATGATGEPPAPDYGVRGLRLVSSERVRGRLVELTFARAPVSPPLERTKVRVLLPKGYGSSNRRYPTLYLLHGAGDRFDGWTEKEDGWPVTLEEFARDKDVVVVMPDGGTPAEPGWYSDWYNDGEFGAPKWETYHIAQLVDFVEERYRVRRDRNGRVLAGLSMGGFGSVSYAARHPDLFAGAFSFSGALDILEIGNAYPEIWGELATEEVRYRGHNPPDLVRNLRDVRVWFRTGQGVAGGPAPKDNDPTGLGIEAGAWQTNESFARAAEDASIRYTYQSYERGAHNWWHWHRALQKFAWPEIVEVFRSDSPARPKRFGFRSIEPSFRVWGWRFDTDRDVVEFLYLNGVRRNRLKLRGSGEVEVTTPRVHHPGRTFKVMVEGEGTKALTRRVTVNRSGRIRFGVKLGPSHDFQQFTPEQRAEEEADPHYFRTAKVTLIRIR